MHCAAASLHCKLYHRLYRVYERKHTHTHAEKVCIMFNSRCAADGFSARDAPLSRNAIIKCYNAFYAGILYRRSALRLLLLLRLYTFVFLFILSVVPRGHDHNESCTKFIVDIKIIITTITTHRVCFIVHRK